MYQRLNYITQISTGIMLNRNACSHVKAVRTNSKERSRKVKVT